MGTGLPCPPQAFGGSGQVMQFYGTNLICETARWRVAFGVHFFIWWSASDRAWSSCNGSESRLLYLGHHFDHHSRPERSKQARWWDDWAGDARSSVTKMSFDWWRSHWVDESIIPSRWVVHPECMKRLSRLNESKDGLYRETEIPTFSREAEGAIQSLPPQSN
jgi:hypothetical protein